MAATGGSIVEVSIAGRTFPVAADADAERDLGGKTIEFQPNGDGVTGRYIERIKGWQVSGLKLAIDDDRGDHEHLLAVQNGTAPGKLADGSYPCSMTQANKRVYSGKGKVTGDLSYNTGDSTCSPTFMGPGLLEAQ